MARKLASVRIIAEVNPIKGKDRVEMALVDGWSCMVSKADNFKPGDKCIFCETDSVFPQTDKWEFLRKYNYRIKTQRFKDGDGVRIYSQGLVLPMTGFENAEVGDDLTEALGITQYEETMDCPAPKEIKYSNPLMRFKLYRSIHNFLFGVTGTREKFPKEVSKTDEERIQNCPEAWKASEYWVASEKVDGSSGTFLLRKHKGFLKNSYEFVVCSRNYKVNDKSTSYWKVAEKYDMEECLKRLIGDYDWICIQGEVLGPGIQKNKYRLEDYDLMCFNLITPRGRLDSILGKKAAEEVGLKWVPIIDPEVPQSYFEGKTVDEILAGANGPSVLRKETRREGIVYRSADGRFSFKAVSPEFQVKYDE